MANISVKTSDAVDSLKAAVEEFAQEYVGNQAYRPRWPDNPKIIHDSLWGTIRLHPWEVAILDLPLFQRLRQIRQTSLVNYVFPGCSHSRFEHTLGVMHQAQRLAEAVNGQYSEDKRPFDHNTIHDLRLAALFHDCGHGCFSHISENTFQFCSDMQAIIEEGPYTDGNPHEVLSALIMQSEAVTNYVKAVADHYKIQFRLDRIPGWIVGNPENDNEEYRYLTQVINGPFDADKLDYVFRDAHYSGLPLTLDLDRLWASCEVEKWEHAGRSMRTLILHRGSTSPLEQILFNKINLFSVVYQHPKVRAVEAMFQGVIEYVRENGLALAGRKLDRATDYLWITDDRFFAAAFESSDANLHKIIHDILYRRHFVRALTISKDTVDVEGNESSYQELRKLNHKKHVHCYEKRRDLARKIWETAGKPCDVHQIWLDLPPDPPTGEADRTIVKMHAGKLRKMSEVFPVQYWVGLYVSHKWRGHVFCPPEHQTKVHDASIAVFADEFGLKFNSSAKELSHIR